MQSWKPVWGFLLVIVVLKVWQSGLDPSLKVLVLVGGLVGMIRLAARDIAAFLLDALKEHRVWLRRWWAFVVWVIVITVTVGLLPRLPFTAGFERATSLVICVAAAAPLLWVRRWFLQRNSDRWYRRLVALSSAGDVDELQQQLARLVRRARHLAFWVVYDRSDRRRVLLLKLEAVERLVSNHDRRFGAELDQLQRNPNFTQLTSTLARDGIGRWLRHAAWACIAAAVLLVALYTNGVYHYGVWPQ